MIPLIAMLLCAQDGAKIDWKKDYDAALQEAQKAGRYVIVHFTGADCPACDMIDQKTFANPAVAERSNKAFVNVRIFIEGRHPLAKQFGLQAIPTTYLVTPGGETVRKWEGFLGPEDYRKGLDSAIAAHEAMKALAPKLKADPDSLELNREAGGHYEALGQARAAADAFKKAALKSPDTKSKAGLIARALGQLYELEAGDALNGEILALADQLDKLDADGSLGRRGDALNARAQAALNQDKKDEAIKLFEEIVEKQPASEKAPVALIWLADLYHHHKKDNAKAEKLLKLLVEKYPKSDLAADAKAMLEHLKEHAEK